MATSRTNQRAGGVEGPPARERRGRAGFTLVEILIALSIAVALMALVSPAVLRWMGEYRFRETLTQVQGAMSRVRADAQRDGGAVEVVQRRVGNVERLVARPFDLGESTTTGMNERAAGGAAGERVLFELPSGFAFGEVAEMAPDDGTGAMETPAAPADAPGALSVEREGAESVLAVFLPDGSAARGPASGTLSDRSGRRAEMTVNTWTGAVVLTPARPAGATPGPGRPVDSTPVRPADIPAPAKSPRRVRRLQKTPGGSPVPRPVAGPRRAGRGGGRATAAVRARGALLLEIMVALAVFVAGGLAVMAMVNRAAASMSLARDYRAAADLARSAMAKIEAGIATPQTLHGPVPAWNPEEDAGQDAGDGMGSGFADSPPAPSGWELEIATEPSAFDGLTMVTVRAVRRAGEGSERTRASYTLRQLVRLSLQGDGSVGDVDPIAGSSGPGRGGRPSGGTDAPGTGGPP